MKSLSILCAMVCLSFSLLHAQMVVKNSAGGAIMTAMQGGNVGIGTTSPDHKLTVAGPMSLSANATYFQWNRLAGNADEKIARMYWYDNGFLFRSHNDDGSIKKDFIGVGHDQMTRIYGNTGIATTPSLSSRLRVGGVGEAENTELGLFAFGVNVYCPEVRPGAMNYGVVGHFNLPATMADGTLARSVTGAISRVGADPGVQLVTGVLGHVGWNASEANFNSVNAWLNVDEINAYDAAYSGTVYGRTLLVSAINNSPENERVWALHVTGAKSYFDSRVGIGRQPDAAYMLDVNGVIRANNVSPSDIRDKTDIHTVDHALDKVSALRGVSFAWKDPQRGEGAQLGFIAQEVEAVLPELVMTDSEGYKALAYDKMTAVLLEAVKELKTELEAQKAENRENRRKIEMLESR